MRYINTKTYYSLLRALAIDGERSHITVYDYRTTLGVAIEFRVNWGGMGPQTPDSTISFVSALAHAASVARNLTRTGMIVREEDFHGAVPADDELVMKFLTIISDADLNSDVFSVRLWDILDRYNKEE